jgi:hypothetical protein
MTSAALINALLYELAKWLIKRKPALAFSPLMKRLLAWCRPDWEQWKVSQTMKSVDSQAAALVQQWEKDDKANQTIQLVQKAQQLFPDAVVTSIPNAPIPSVMIEKEAASNASDAVKALGGEMRIVSSFALDDTK